MTTMPSPLLHNLRLQLTYHPIEAIKPNPRDPRVYSAAETRRIAKALRTFGAMPLIVTSDHLVLSGNVWLMAAKQAGITPLPVIVADHLTPAQAEAFMVAQARLIENGVWDQKKLGQILRDLTLEEIDFDLEITGFEVGEIDLCIAALDTDDQNTGADDQAPPSGPLVSRLGDMWILGPHKILCGDALKPESYLRLMGPGKPGRATGRPGDSRRRDSESPDLADIVFTDPPYNVRIGGNVSGLGAVKHGEFAMASGEMSEAEFTRFLIQALTLTAQHSADGSLAYVCMDWRHLHELTVAGRQAYGGALQNLCVWTKTNGAMGSLYRSQHELVFVFKKGQAPHRNNVQLGRFGRNRTNVWSYPGANTFGRGGEEGDLLALHPTVKPVALITDILRDASARGEVVLDPFLGSGSTLIAAEKVARRCRSIELDPRYVDAAIRRWQAWTGESARLDGDGRTFLQVAKARSEARAEGEARHG